MARTPGRKPKNPEQQSPEQQSPEQQSPEQQSAGQQSAKRQRSEQRRSERQRARAEREAMEEALNRAQIIAFDAFEARTAKRRVALAEKALAISPFCADAYGILARHAAPGSDAELDLWRKAVEAGRAALGPAAFEDCAGAFWGFIETRPFMRAMEGFAGALWSRGDLAAAAEAFGAMLELNPNDNQGARFCLAAVLLEADDDDRLATLIETYPEDSMADGTYTRALAAFRRSGDDAASRAQRAAALEANAHVPAYLTGAKAMPARRPPYYSPGDASEAVCYAELFGKAWARTPGALDWLRAATSPPPPKPNAARAAAGTRRKTPPA